MKQILFFILVTFTFNCIVAQPNNNHNAMIQTLLTPQITNSQNSLSKTATLTERVIGQCTRKNSGWTRTDSVQLNYIINGTSTFDFNQMLFPYNYPYNTSPLFNYLGTYATPQVLYKTYKHWTINPNTLVYGFYEKNITNCDFNKNLICDTTLYADSTTRPNTIFNNKFNALNKIDSAFTFNFIAGVKQNAFQQFFEYNASNKLIKDSIYEFHIGSWYLVSKTFYNYDVSNNLIQIHNYANNSDPTFTVTLKEQLRYINTYDAFNRLQTVETSYYIDTILKPFVTDTFAYTSAYNFHTSWKQDQYDPINLTWNPISKMNKILNAAGFPDTVKTYSYDTFASIWSPAYKYYVTYNANNNPLKMYQYNYNFTSFPTTPNFTTSYYYETFTNTTALNNAVSEISNINFYPNPTQNTLTISSINNQHLFVTISIYDLQGKLFMKQLLQPVSGTLQLNTSSLNSGMYLVVVQDKNSNVLNTKTVIKN